MRGCRFGCQLAVAVLLLAVVDFSRAAETPAVAAAADLKFALDEVAARFLKDKGKRVRLAFGSSGNFARQIEQGAPFELYLSADETYVSRLAAAGRTQDEGALYAIGRIVLFAPRGSPVAVDSDLRDLRAALSDGRVRRFAIANPEHAPYGRAAREALQQAGLWDAARPRLVLGENAAQATQFATSGDAQGGIIPLSLARAPAVSALGSFALIPAQAHRPLRQRMVLIKGAGETARAFYGFLQQPGTREIFRRYGFMLPGEE